MPTPVPNHDRPSNGQPASPTAKSSSIAKTLHEGPRCSVREGDRWSPPRRKSSLPNGKVNMSERCRRDATSKGQLNQLGWADRLAVHVVENQIRMSFSILSGLVAAYLLLPSFRPQIARFYSLSSYNPASGRYAKGADDMYFVFFWIVVFTFLRAAAFEYVFVPLGKRWGVKSEKGLVRFSEQAWLLAYYSIIWPLGMYLMYNSPYWNNVHHLWTDWPLRELGYEFKWYYLVQFAFWLQQIFVLNIEPRRKDFHQMFAHHIITSCLIAASYAYHMTRVGNAILCIMDIGDILLAIAKNLKYMGYHVLCDYAFGVFLISWVIGRHLIYMRIVVSAWKDSVRHIPFGCYTSDSATPFPIPEGVSGYWPISQTFSYSNDIVCFTKPIQMSFIACLVALQIITLCWFYMIMAVAWRVVQGGVAEDTRSDDEEEEKDEKEEKRRNGGDEDDEEHEGGDLQMDGEDSVKGHGVDASGRGISPDRIDGLAAGPLSASRPNGKPIPVTSLPPVMYGISHRHLSSQPFGNGG